VCLDICGVEHRVLIFFGEPIVVTLMGSLVCGPPLESHMWFHIWRATCVHLESQVCLHIWKTTCIGYFWGATYLCHDLCGIWCVDPSWGAPCACTYGEPRVLATFWEPRMSPHLGSLVVTCTCHMSCSRDLHSAQYPGQPKTQASFK
jgi:hypothetical protein